MNLERISSKKIEVTRNDDSKSLVVSGYAAVYNSESKLITERGKTFVEVIAQDAFLETIRNVGSQSVDCVATFNHDRGIPLARTSSGTLKLESDAVGLRFEFEMPETSLGRDMSVMMERGDINQCSFVAIATSPNVEMRRDESGVYVQTIKSFDAIRDISLVVDPAYPSTFAQQVERSIKDYEDNEAEVKRKLEEENALKESQIEKLNNIITRADEN